MADNDQLLKQIGNLIDTKLDEKLEPIKSDVAGIKKDLQDVKHGQQEQGKQLTEHGNQLDTLLQGQAHINSVLKVVATKQDIERLEDGQDELQAILHTREAKLAKKVKEHEERIAELEKHTGLTNPHKN